MPVIRFGRHCVTRSERYILRNGNDCSNLLFNHGKNSTIIANDLRMYCDPKENYEHYDNLLRHLK
jgi:Uma2 family endonuclease